MKKYIKYALLILLLFVLAYLGLVYINIKMNIAEFGFWRQG